jgi:hypothetical protein
MASHLETVAAELGHVGTGVDRAAAMAAEADQQLQRSIDAAVRGGFPAILANLRGAQEQLRQARGMLSSVKSEVDSATAAAVAAPKEVDAGQLASLLSPLVEQVSTIRTSLQDVGQQLVATAKQIAASASGNPAVAILTNGAHQALAPAAQRLGSLLQTINAAVADAKAAHAGER